MYVYTPTGVNTKLYRYSLYTERMLHRTPASTPNTESISLRSGKEYG